MDLRNKEIAVEGKNDYFSEAIKSTINTYINLTAHINSKACYDEIPHDSFIAGVVTLHTTVLL